MGEWEINQGNIMNHYKQLLILSLSGIAEWKNEKEIIIPKDMAGDFELSDTCEPLGDGRYVLRDYRECGQLYWQTEYLNGRRDGLDCSWRDSGKLWMRQEYKNGKFHGHSVVWYRNGQKKWEAWYENNRLHGTFNEWHEDGSVKVKTEYKHGTQVERLNG